MFLSKSIKSQLVEKAALLRQADYEQGLAPFAARGGLRRSLRSARLGTGSAGRCEVILNEKEASTR